MGYSEYASRRYAVTPKDSAFVDVFLFATVAAVAGCTSGKNIICGKTGIVVMGDDSCLRGRGFESQRCILDGHVIFSL